MIGPARACGAVAFVVVVAGCWIPAWSRDEAATVMVVRRPLAQVWRTWAFDPALEPSYLMTNAWATVSTSPLWLRLPSVLATAVAAGLVVAIARRFVGPRAAYLAGVVFVLLPAVTRYGQDARPYAVTAMLSALIVHLWLGDRRLTVRRGGVVVGALIALGLTHAYALLILPVLLITALVAPERDRRAESVAVLRTGGTAVALLSPFLWLVARGARGQPDPIPVNPLNLVAEAIRLPVAVLRPTSAVPLGALVLVLAVAGLIIGARTAGPTRDLAALAAVWLLLPPLLLIVLQSVTDVPGVVARYWTFVLPALALACGPLFETAGRRTAWLGPSVVGAVALLGVPTQVALRGVDGHTGLRWAAAVEALDRPAFADMAIVVDGSIYRTMIVHRPAMGERMPLVVDPAPSGRILPETARPGSDRFETLRTYDRMVVLQNRPGTSRRIPVSSDFPVARSARRVMSEPALFCSYFGDPLAVFTTQAATPTAAEVRAWAEVLTALDPVQVHCAASRR